MLSDKLEKLRSILGEMERAVVAFSGGVDSTVLLKVAQECLGGGLLAVTADSPSLPRHELEEALRIARQVGARHIVVGSHEQENPRYLANDPLRCYYCKESIYKQLIAYADSHGYRYVLDGANADDAGDYRPGARAATEQGVRSPLQEAGLSKTEVRELAREMGLPNWDKPASACLASRVPYGTPITSEALNRVEQAEATLRSLGIARLRVRDHGEIARIEVAPRDFPLLLERRELVVARLKRLGYTYVALDLAGFRSGSMNEVLKTNG